MGYLLTPALTSEAEISHTTEARPRVPAFTYRVDWPLERDAVLAEAKAYAEAEFRFRLDVLRGIGFQALTRPTVKVMHGPTATLRMESLVSGPHATALDARRPLFLGSK